MRGLKEKTIAITGSRRAAEISELVRKTGGTPISYPIQGELILNETKAEENVKSLLSRPFDYIVLTTGIGAEVLEKVAIKADCFDRYIQKIKTEALIVRGSKTLKWLKKHEISPFFAAEEGIMENLLQFLREQKSRKGKTLFLQSYHQDERFIKNELEKYGYNVFLSQPYTYKEPDRFILNNLKHEIKEEKVNAVIFTTKKQVENLFADNGDVVQLVQAFNNAVEAVAVGKVTAKTLESHGIKKVYFPENQRMGAMVIGLSRLLK